MSNEYDIDNDGKVSEREFMIFQRKMVAQRHMATAAITSIVVFTAVLMSPVVSIDRVNALSDVFSMFYITTGGIVAAFFGTAAWMGKR